MRYGRIIKGEIVDAPLTVTIKDMTVCNPTAEQYLSIGWYPVIFTDAPELTPDSEYMAVPRWEQGPDSIVQVWDIVPIPEPEPPKPHVPTLEERVGVTEQRTVENRELIDILVNGQTEEVTPDGLPTA